VIIEHFRRSVLHRLGGGQGDGSSRHRACTAVWYKLAFEATSRERLLGHPPFGRPSAGTVRDPDTGIGLHRPGMNKM